MSSKQAAGPIRAIGGTRPSNGYQQITDVSAAVGLTVPTSNPACFYAVIQCEGTPLNYVRWRDDGTDPTSSVGMQLFCGSELNYHGPLDVIKFIDGAGVNILNVTFYT